MHAHYTRGDLSVRLCEPLRLASYLISHLDGLGYDLHQAPRAQAKLAASCYAHFVQNVSDVLRDLWTRRGCWTSAMEFDVLRNIGHDVLSDGGLILRRLRNGEVYVDIPFTSDTIPT